MEKLALVAVISQFLGISVRDLLRIRGMKGSMEAGGAANLPLIRFLSVFEGQDELVGQWKVGRWENPRLSREGFNAWGSLLVLFKYPDKDSWKAVLVLTYNKKFSKRADLPLEPAWRKQRGNLFKGIYDVELCRAGQGYRGSTSMTYRDPEIGLRFEGKFERLTLDSDGNLEGTFVNSATRGKVPAARTKVEFHQRKRWRELQSVN
ncbi:MAG: hypothetical protein JW753_09565 [Dehalococcoidia bacterium]|nr:hypothetical protein [Dehalococcoidia bacterium]